MFNSVLNIYGISSHQARSVGVKDLSRSPLMARPPEANHCFSDTHCTMACPLESPFNSLWCSITRSSLQKRRMMKHAPRRTYSQTSLCQHKDSRARIISHKALIKGYKCSFSITDSWAQCKSHSCLWLCLQWHISTASNLTALDYENTISHNKALHSFFGKILYIYNYYQVWKQLFSFILL